MAEARYLRVIWMIAAIAAGVLVILLLARSAPVAQARHGTDTSARGQNHTKVVCLDENTFKHEYKFRPHHCIFHKRHSPNAEAFFVRTKHDRWKVWRHRHARGRGTATASMVGDTPVKIKLLAPVTRCGHRVFSKAHFRFPGIGSSGTVKLSTCA
jgi:hypothetical protein